MANLRNNVQLIGRLGADPEVRTFDSGKRQAVFSLATNDSYKNQKGEKVEETQWHNIVIWGKLSDIAGQYLKKGSEVAVQGKLVHRTFETTAGDKRYVTEIVVNDLVMFSNRT